jgi:putative addiction module killer protein
MIKILTYKTEMGKEPYKEFLASIRDPKAKTAVAKAVTKMEQGLPGQVDSVGKGVKEQKIYVGKGYRIYFYNDGQEIIILLGGSHKGDQKREIQNAQTYLEDYKRQKATIKRRTKS